LAPTHSQTDKESSLLLRCSVTVGYLVFGEMKHFTWGKESSEFPYEFRDF